MATIRHGIISSASNRPEQVHFSPGSARKIRSQNAARRMRNGDAVIITPSSDNIIRTHKHRLKEQAGTAFRCNHRRRATLTHC